VFPTLRRGATKTIRGMKKLLPMLTAVALVGGASAAVAVLLGAAAIIAAHSVRRVEQVPRPRVSRLAAAAGRSGLAPTLVTGLRFAFDPGARPTTNPSRSVVAGAAIALACLAGAITFSASLSSLIDQPARFGWTSDAVMLGGNGYGNISLDGARRVLDADEQVDAWGGAYFGSAKIEGLDLPLLGMAADAATRPPLVDGRYPANDREVVLGAATAERLGVAIGDPVRVAGEGGESRLRVTGLAVFPTIGIQGAAHTSLGDGALLAPELIPGWDLNITAERQGDFGPRGIFVRFRPGTDTIAEVAHLQEEMAPIADFSGITVVPVQRPAEIVNARSIGRAPVLLAVALSLGSIVSLVLALASAVRRRRRDLAVLRSLGCTRRQLAATVGWQATVTTLAGLAIGVPLGVATGRVLWNAFARELHVVDRPAVPVLALLGLVVTAVALANLAALGPARAAGRVAGAPVRSR
jgi:hypothetical protein